MKLQEIDFIEAQKTEKPGYLSRGIRMDLYVKDEQQSVYNVEVQASAKKNLPRRMRYYQSVMDSTILAPGADYQNLQTSYVIFICNYDLFKEGRYLYWFDNRCQDEPDMVLRDGAEKIIVNTRGYRGMITENLQEIITYLNLGIATGNYTRRLEDSVAQIKYSEERKIEYMVMAIREMEIREEARVAGYEEGREEGRGQGLDRGIRGAVELLRDDGKSDKMIISKIMQKYDLTEEKAAAYVFR